MHWRWDGRGDRDISFGWWFPASLWMNAAEKVELYDWRSMWRCRTVTNKKLL